MRRHLRHFTLAAVIAVGLGGLRTAEADSWIFRPSYYTHDLETGQRVAQFAPAVTPYVAIDPTYQRSGYIHSESTLQVGDSADHTHIVETWGQGAAIRPYGEWLYPYRPGATPYNPGWGPGGAWTQSGAVANPYGANPAPYAQPNLGLYGPAAPYAPQSPGLSPPPNPAPPAPPSPAPAGGAGT
jgi:hypothetical protein